MLESMIFDLNTLPQDRQKHALSCALIHTCAYEIVFPTLDPLEDRKQLQTCYLSVKRTNYPVGGAWRNQLVFEQDSRFHQTGVSLGLMSIWPELTPMVVLPGIGRK